MLTDLLDTVGLVAIAIALGLLAASVAIWLGVLVFGIALLAGSWLIDAAPKLAGRFRR